jgi:hypothetical protein
MSKCCPESILIWRRKIDDNFPGSIYVFWGVGLGVDADFTDLSAL